MRVDNAEGARLVAEELLALGHHAIAAVFGPETTSTGRDREASFRRVLADAGIELRAERWRRAPFDFSEGHRCALELLPSEPTALFAANDILALGAYNALYAKGIRVPADITLIGFDDVRLAGVGGVPAHHGLPGHRADGQDEHRAAAVTDRRGTRRAPGAAAGGAAGAVGAAGHPWAASFAVDL